MKLIPHTEKNKRFSPLAFHKQVWHSDVNVCYASKPVSSDYAIHGLSVYSSIDSLPPQQADTTDFVASGQAAVRRLPVPASFMMLPTSVLCVVSVDHVEARQLRNARITH